MDEEITGIKISEFPNAPSINSSDVVTGLHEGNNANFTFSRIMAWFREAVTEFFVPTSREINGQALTGDVTLTADDVEAADRDIIASVETDMGHQAQNAYTPGQMMILPGGVLFKATTNIAVGDTLNQGTNIERVTVSDRIMEVEGEIPNSPDDIGAASESIVAQKESSATSAHAYAVGNYLILGGILYKVTAPIAIGDTIAAGTNVESVTIGGELEEIKGDIPTQPSDIGAQDEILVSGILKGDGQGGVSAATPGTDYGTYSKPSGGIPSTDMTSAVQTSLRKADTAYQKPSNGIPASDLANGVIPSVPSASTSNPQMDGTASPGSTGEWADGGHVHPTDTSRVPTSRTINGYDLTADRTLTAADVGALAENGTAVGAKRLVYDHQVVTSGGWYKVFELTSAGTNRSYQLTMLIDNGYNSNRFGILSFYLNHSSAGNLSGSARWLSTAFPLTEFRYTVDNTTKTFTLYAYQSQGRLYFRILSADSRSPSDTYFNPSQCWKSVSVSEPTTAALVSPPIGYAIQYTSVTVSAGTNQQIISISDARINGDFALARIEWADPSYITAGYTWTTATGSFELSGTCTTATTANILLVRKVD